MKISVLTFSKSKNYGGNLQCYALSTYLKQLGHIVEQIDIQRPAPKMSLISRILRFSDYIFFPLFWFRYIVHYSRPYKTLKEIELNPPQNDAIIVGSDQVWNPDLTKSLDPLVYFLPFAPDTTKKIAYAASFGMSEWTDNSLAERIKPLIKDFTHIGVREVEGVQICSKVFGVESKLVLDPTFLIYSYDEICGKYDKTIKHKGLVLFKFENQQKIDSVCLELSEKLFEKPILLHGTRKISGFTLKRFVSVPRWLRTIRYAKYIVTDSFHCTVFCILFHKQFITTSYVSSRNSRIITLLNSLGLEERFCPDLKTLHERGVALMQKSINYEEVDLRKKKLQEESRNFLIQALNS